MRQEAYIGIGSNLGDKAGNCLRAIDWLNRFAGCEILARSDLFQTEPHGFEDQDWFVNGVVSLGTDLSAHELLRALLHVEKGMGRVRKRRWDSRVIDLDILLYGEDVIQERDLVVPHPHMHLRRFVLVPLIQLAPNLVHPTLGKTMAELLRDCPEEGQSVILMKGV